MKNVLTERVKRTGAILNDLGCLEEFTTFVQNREVGNSRQAPMELFFIRPFTSLDIGRPCK